ncbi:Rv1535 domain-containing protein [Mycobacterium simiae]|uniref:Rv1535 domain-containing protein n=1 Tax=Mycobacterium simiae TaxID=1784 RepID=UPI0021CDD01C|nr:Rv1535 domain-containing protein [Mycobacterium simiae]
MVRNDAVADPLISSFAALLTVPLREIYALLWRVGVVEIVEREPAFCRASGPGLRVPACRPYCPKCDSERPSRRSLQRRSQGPVPTRPGRAGYSRAVG